MKSTITLTFDEKMLTKFAKYEAFAKESTAKVRERIASDESCVLFHIDNSLDEENRKFEKAIADAAKAKADEAKNSKNAAKAEFLESFKVEFAKAEADNDSAKKSELIAKLLTFN